MELWTAFLVGLLGSMHCVGMCGPIALALPYQGSNPWFSGARVLVYNGGRVVTYSIIGLLIGFFGQAIFLAGMQVYVSISLGILLLFVALFSINVEGYFYRVPFFNRFNVWVKTGIGKLMRSRRPAALLGLGMLNGLLPCGLVYMAVAGAVSTGNAWSGSAYMALFGLGTVPLMLATAMAGQFISLNWRRRIRRLLPAFLIFFAFLFIARGLNFEIPDSIRFWENLQEVPMCND